MTNLIFWIDSQSAPHHLLRGVTLLDAAWIDGQPYWLATADHKEVDLADEPEWLVSEVNSEFDLDLADRREGHFESEAPLLAIEDAKGRQWFVSPVREGYPSEDDPQVVFRGWTVTVLDASGAELASRTLTGVRTPSVGVLCALVHAQLLGYS